MTKPKLTDAVKQPSQSLPATAPTPGAAADSGSGGTAGTPPVAAKGDGDADDPTAAVEPVVAPAAAATAETPKAEAPAAGSLESYQAVFGDIEGCVYFAKKVDFTTACTQHMAQQVAVITTLTAENATLKTQNKALAGEVLGEVDPVKVKTDAKTSDTSSVSQYEAILAAKIAKL